MLKLIYTDKVLHGDRLADVVAGEIDLISNTSKVKIKYQDTGKTKWIDSLDIDNFDLIQYMKRKGKKCLK